MALLAFAAPILPGKLQQWKDFTGELNGSKRREYASSRQRQGVHERAFLQQSPQGDMVIVTLEGNNPGEALRQFGAGTDAFSNWFVEQVKQIHGMDLRDMSKMPLPELWIDSQATRTMGA